MRLLRVIRLDASDTQVYHRPAAPGEWAVTGSAIFADLDPDALSGPQQQAFRHAFLGVESFGWTTLVEIAEIGEVAYRQVIERLAWRLVERLGAPDIEAALPTARDEVDYAASIGELEPHTLLSIERERGADGIVERLRIVRPNAGDHAQARLWAFEE